MAAEEGRRSRWGESRNQCGLENGLMTACGRRERGASHVDSAEDIGIKFEGVLLAKMRDRHLLRLLFSVW